MEYLSPQGVLLPLVYGTTASPLWLELRGRSAWQATPSWTVYRLACHRLLPWLRVTFAMVPDAAWPGSDEQPWSTAPATGPVGRLGRPSVNDPWGVGSFLCVRCPGPPGSCSPVCPLGVLCCVCGVLGLPAPVHGCARSVCCVGCAVSWASWLLFTGVPARCVVLRVRCPGPPGSCSPTCPLGVLCCVCGVLGLPAPVHRCARSVCCFACSVSWATWLLFTGVPARCVVLGVRCPGPPGSCSPVCPLGVLFCVCGVLGLPAPVHRCAPSVCCVACAVSWASRLLFTGVPARCVVLRLRCPGPPGSCSPVRHGDAEETEEAKRIIEMEKAMEQEGGRCFVVMANRTDLAKFRGARVQAIGEETLEQWMVAPVELVRSVLTEDWSDDYAASKHWSKYWNAVSAPSDDEWPEGLTEDGDKLFLKVKLLVPENRVEELIDHWHNAQLMHPGRDKMQQDLEWRFKFPPGYYAILDKYCSDCAVCRATKSPNHSTAGNPVYTAIPEAPMRSVAMDVFAMPEVTVEGETYHCVILGVDRHSGYIVAVPDKKSKKKDKRDKHGAAGQDRR